MEDKFFDDILARMGVKSDNEVVAGLMRKELRVKLMEVTMKGFYACVSDKELDHFEQFSDLRRKAGPVKNETVVLEFMSMYEDLSLKVMEVVYLYVQKLVDGGK